MSDSWQRFLTDLSIARAVDELDSYTQEALLREMVRQERVAIHVESLSTTYDVEDVYDNSYGEGGTYPVLTILYVGGD